MLDGGLCAALTREAMVPKPLTQCDEHELGL
jgi:hypothetical protein